MGARSAAWVTACASASVYTAAVFFIVTIFHAIPSVYFMSVPLPLPLPPLALALTVEPFETSPLDIDVEKKAQADELSTAEPIDYSENTEDTGPHTFGPPVKPDDDEDFDGDQEDEEELPDTEIDGGSDTLIGIGDDADIGNDVTDVDGDEFDAAIEESNDLKRATSNEIGVLVILDSKNASDVKSSDNNHRRNRMKKRNETRLSDNNRNSNETNNKRGNVKKIITDKGRNSSRRNDGIRSEKRISDIDAAKIRNKTEEDTQEIIAKVVELPRSSTVKSLGSRKLGGQMQTIEGTECNTHNSTIECLTVTQSPESSEGTPKSVNRKNSLIRIAAGFANGTRPVKEIMLQNNSVINEFKQGAMNHSSLDSLNSLNRQEGAESKKRSYHADETQVQAPVEEIVSYDYGEIAEIIIPENAETYGSNNPQILDRSYGIQSYIRPNDQSNPHLYRNYPNSDRNSEAAPKTSQEYLNYAPRFNTNGHQTSNAPPPTYSFYGASEDTNSPYFPRDPTPSSNIGSSDSTSGKDSGPSTEFEGYYYDPPSNSQNEKLSSGIYDFTTKSSSDNTSPGSSLNSGLDNRENSSPDSHFPNSYGPKSSYDQNLSAEKSYGGSNLGSRPPYNSYNPMTNRGPNLSSENIYNDKSLDSHSRPIENSSPRSNYDPNLDTEKFSNGSPNSYPVYDGYDPKTEYDLNLSREKPNNGKESDLRSPYDSHGPNSNHDSSHGPAKLRDGSNPVTHPHFGTIPKSEYNPNLSPKKSKGSSDSPKSNDYDLNSNREKSRGGDSLDARPHFDSYNSKSSFDAHLDPEKSHGTKSTDTHSYLNNYNPKSNYHPGLGPEKSQGGRNPDTREKSFGNIPKKKPVIYEFFETPNSKTWKSHESIPVINPSTDSGPPIVEIIYHRTNGVVYEDDDDPTLSPEFATTPSYDDRFPEIPKVYPKDFESKTRNKNRSGAAQNSKKGGKNINSSREYSTDELISKAKELNNFNKSIVNQDFPVHNKETKNSNDSRKSTVDLAHFNKSQPKDSRKILDDFYFPVNAKVTDLGSQGEQKQIKAQDHPTKVPNPWRKPSKERNSSSERIRFPDFDEPRKTPRKPLNSTKGATRDKSSENVFSFPKEDTLSKIKEYDHHDDFDFDGIDETPKNGQEVPRTEDEESPSSENKKRKKSKGEKNTTAKEKDEFDDEKGSKKKDGHHEEGKEVREGVKKGEKGKKEGNYETKKKSEDGKKENKFDDGTKYLKGQSTKGRHEVHKKDEFSRKRSFFDEHHENDQHEKEGGHEVSQKNGDGIKYHAGKKKEGYKEDSKRKEGKRKKGTQLTGGEEKEFLEEDSEKEVQSKGHGKITKKEEDDTKDFEL